MSRNNDKRGKAQFSPYHSDKYSSLYSDKMREDLQKFVFGNFHFYYGYRNQETKDNRITCLKEEWISGKDVLDVGCNAGHFTLSVAHDLSPKLIVGIDIDDYLIRVARKNVAYYLNDVDTEMPYPQACVVKYGPLAESVISDKIPKFPYNVAFIQGNYVLDADDQLQMQYAEFDTVLFLSISKWIQLNWGDDGLKRTFHRIFRHLRPGGYLVLEAQPFSSYKKKKSLNESIKANFNKMKFFPEQFNEFLLKDVGFETCELIDKPAHSSKGFSRPMYLFTKAADSSQEEKFVPTHIKFSYNSDSDNVSDVDELSD